MPIYIWGLFLVFEFLYITYVKKKKYPFFDVITSITSRHLRKYFLKLITFLGYLDISHYAYKYRFFTIESFSILDYVIIFIFIDFGYYWTHRAGHIFRIFWIPHSIHHMPNDLMIARASQQSISSIFMNPLFLVSIPMALLGIPPKVFWPLFALNATYQEYLHNDFVPRLGFLEKFLNTPAQHRIHHSTKKEHINKNFSGVFCIWDRIFGTFHMDDDKQFLYGVIPSVQNQHLFTPLVYEAKQLSTFIKELILARGIKEKLKIAFEDPAMQTKTIISNENNTRLAEIFGPSLFGNK